jgi:outer membrane receptor protein involved in Fe transport
MNRARKPGVLRGQKRALVTAVSAALASAQSATAQEAPSPSAGLEEIVVTATKRAASLQDVPVSVTAFGTEDIEKHDFKGIQDYAAFVPSLSFATREPGGTSVVFRGVATSGVTFASNSSSSIYLDEQPITSNGDNPDPRLVDIERIEALSGPQGTLFGASSQSGTLRIITNKPDTKEFSSWVDAGASTIKDGGTGYDLSAMVNMPLVEDKLALRFVGFKAEDAGYIDNVLSPSPGTCPVFLRPSLGCTGTVNNSPHFDNSANVAKDVNTIDTLGGRGALRWDIGEEWSLDFTALFQNKAVHGSGDFDPGLGDLQQIRFENEELTDDWWQTGLTISGDVGFADTVVSVAYFQRNFRYEMDNTTYEFNFGQFAAYTGYLWYDFSPFDPNNFPPTDQAEFGGDPRGIAFDHRKDHRTSLEARLTSHGESRWSWLAGVFYNKESGHTTFDAFMRGYDQTVGFHYYSYYEVGLTGRPLDPTQVWFVGIYDTSLEEGAVFGEFTYNFTDHFAITAGGRWFHYDDTFSLVQNQPTGFTGYTLLDRETKSDDGDFVSKLNLSYKFDEGRMVYFTYSEGFRNGGSTPVRDRSVLPGTYQPDLLKNYELGAKTEWLDRRLRLNLTTYYMTWDDIQIQVEDPQPGVFALAVVNFPQAEIQGGDGELQWLALDNLTIGTSLSYIDSKLSQAGTLCFPNPPGPDVCLPPVQEGTPLPLTPDWKATFSVDYTVGQQVMNASPFFRFDYSYTGESFNSLAGFESITLGTHSNQLDAYNETNIQFGLESAKWTTTFSIENVTDERAEQFINNRWGSPRISINRPRTFGLTFKYSF